MEEDRDMERPEVRGAEVPHFVDLPSPATCPHDEIVYFHAAMDMRAQETIRALRLYKRARVVNLGAMWLPSGFFHQSLGEDIEKALPEAEKAEAVERAYKELEWYLKEYVKPKKSGKITSAWRDGITRGEVPIHLYVRPDSELPAMWVKMRREDVRLISDYWETEDGEVF
jgi:hypothetical protein